VHFYLEKNTTPTFFKWSDLRLGSTMCIFYAKRHQFMDFTEGIRQENADTVMVFPVSLKELIKVCDQIGNNPSTCFGCNQKMKDLKLCSRCKTAMYCSRECQVAHWKGSHKKLCRHMNMLSNLVKMDFSTFDGFTHWDFSREPRLTSEDRQNALNEYSQKMSTKPLKKNQRLLKLLESLEDIVLESDDIGKQSMESQGCQSHIYSERIQNGIEFTSPLSNNSLFRAFISLARRIADGDKEEERYFVTDAKSNCPITDMYNDLHFTSLFVSLPQWQLRKGITGISWSFETHHLLRAESVFSPLLWTVKTEDSSLIAQNEHACAFYHDDIRIVVDIANAMAKNEPDTLVVRVLRTAGVASSMDSVPVVARSQTPSNLITLWIREDLATQGVKFNDLCTDKPLVDQLTDYKQLSLAERLSNRIET